MQYGGSGSSMVACHIDAADLGVSCEITVHIRQDMKGPLHVFYEIDGFYQNHRSYLGSLNWDQLHPKGPKKDPDEDTLKEDCKPLWKNGTKILHPCGVMPNTLFNDVISLTNEELILKEDDIAWRSDIKELYRMPEDFSWRFLPGSSDANDACLVTGAYTSSIACDASLCADAGWDSEICFGYVCTGGHFDNFACDSGELVLFTYGGHEKFQYLYETFPQVVSPLVGVNSEHFAVWMKIAALPTFRKLYGRINANLDKGSVLTFQIENNFDVNAFSGKKALIVATSNGFELDFLALSYIILGCASLGIAVVFASLQLLKPRHMGDIRYIPWLLSNKLP